MFAKRKEDGIAHQGVNILVHHYPRGGEGEKPEYLIEVYTIENGKGDSMRYATIAEKAFGPARKMMLDKIRAEIAASKEKDGEAMSKARTGDQKAKVAQETQEHINALQQKLANPLHNLNEEDAKKIFSIGIATLKKLGLRLRGWKSRDEFNLEMHESYRLYA